ncbi:hypothetical protein BBK82_10030 [Lentzea guizhouensis]|uniref:DUF4307 domain-containing protein n=1 Tax=Lentzea guizhouensis TaxID=1586287 RepID=A0A1B2HF54_9PSEU|nr:DUF4307 domain-containing protein [Lentzea guizhouensis]ANZ36351.1 hypothetical protein BBK82_10030 [Lentzea guizhouensis]
MAQRALPEGRYGRSTRKKLPWWARVALLAVAVGVGAVVAIVGYRNLGTKPIEAEQTAFQILDSERVEVTFQVSRDQPERPAVCIIRARSKDGDEAGRREVLVPPGNSTVVETTVVRGSKPPVTGEVFGCSYQVPAYLSTS